MKFASRIVFFLVLVFPLGNLAFAQNIAPQDQDVINAMNAGAPNGAIINTDESCAILTGFLNGNSLVAFGGLFPDEDGCRGGTFSRTTPQGKTDLHLNGTGQFFLLLFDPFNIFGSEGSDVKWKMIRHEDGISILTINGWLSDGSRVRAHFTSDPRGDDNAKGDFLWIEGIGYVLGRI